VVPISAPPQPDFEAEIVVCSTKTDLQTAVQQGSVIVTLGRILAQYPFLTNMEKPLVVDLYDPFLLAGLHRFYQKLLSNRMMLNERYRKTHHFQLNAADFMICASEKQRDYWLGMLAGFGRINPLTSDDDPTLRRLLDVVPFGLPVQPPQHTRHVLKGVHKKITLQDKVILWGGGIWNWFDAPTMIRAMTHIAQHRKDVKLFFMGINRPNTAIPKMAVVDHAIALSKELGLYDQTVFFNDWVPYNQRQNYLLEADIGVSLHLDHAETRFAFRTRFLDYLWAGLPMVVTEGDTLSELVQTWDLGHIVKPGDVEGVAAAILQLLDRPNLRESYQTHFSSVSGHYHWDKVVQPLLKFCLNPYQAPDKTYSSRTSGFSKYTMGWMDDYNKVTQVIRRDGIKQLPKEVMNYLKWKLNLS
jgi:glycosyltransferase involved in cell wall biosynthesis